MQAALEQLDAKHAALVAAAPAEPFLCCGGVQELALRIDLAALEAKSAAASAKDGKAGCVGYLWDCVQAIGRADLAAGVTCLRIVGIAWEAEREAAAAYLRAAFV